MYDRPEFLFRGKFISFPENESHADFPNGRALAKPQKRDLGVGLLKRKTTAYLNHKELQNASRKNVQKMWFDYENGLNYHLIGGRNLVKNLDYPG